MPPHYWAKILNSLCGVSHTVFSFYDDSAYQVSVGIVFDSDENVKFSFSTSLHYLSDLSISGNFFKKITTKRSKLNKHGLLH